jgi:hypothetical protein
MPINCTYNLSGQGPTKGSGVKVVVAAGLVALEFVYALKKISPSGFLLPRSLGTKPYA